MVGFCGTVGTATGTHIPVRPLCLVTIGGGCSAQRAFRTRGSRTTNATVLVLLRCSAGILPLRIDVPRWLAAGTRESTATVKQIGGAVRKYPLSLLVVACLGGCVVAPPPSPRVAVMPAPGKPFDQFTAEDRECRDWAERSSGTNSTERAQQSFVNSAALGTVVGAAAGALIGGNRGAASGAGAGLVVGSAVGADNAGYVARDAQRRYDIAYQQCMYSKGNQIPGQRYSGVSAPPPPSGNAPPTADYPPSTYPPPPPSGQ